MNTTQEWVLVEKARSGDPGAFSELVNRYHRDVYRTVYNRMLSREDAEDITQDTFIKALTSLHQLGSPHKFKQWIRRIAINACANHVKRNCRLSGSSDLSGVSHHVSKRDCFASLAMTEQESCHCEE